MRAISTLILVLALSFVTAERALSQVDDKARSDDRAAVKAAVEKSLPLLQRVGTPFIEKTGCASCHHNFLPAIAIASARERGFKVDEEAARRHLQARTEVVAGFRVKAMEVLGPPGDANTVSYSLLGLAADRQPADKATDAVVHYLMGKQAKDGRWKPVAYRPPLEYSDITATAITVRALQMYAPGGRAEELGRRSTRARAWLEGAPAKTNEERAFRLLGLGWTNAGRKEIEKAVKELLAHQRADGGWAQLPTLDSDAYATGQALVAFRAGAVPTSDPAYRRGVRFLLKTQLEDGSWLVRSRAIPLQKYFESGFPHGKDQWISAAGTSWAMMALLETVNTSTVKNPLMLSAAARR